MCWKMLENLSNYDTFESLRDKKSKGSLNDASIHMATTSSKKAECWQTEIQIKIGLGKECTQDHYS